MQQYLILQCYFFRALSRIGNAYYKKEDLYNALIYFNKSLSEHRDQDIVKKTLQVCHKVELVLI